MLLRIEVSEDKHNAVVHFSTHSVEFYSDKDVNDLINEIVIEPGQRLEARHRAADEVTMKVELDPQLPLFTEEAA